MENSETTEIDKSLKIIASASFIVFITTILSKVLTYLYRIIIARYYNPEVYGTYSISLMVIGWITVFAGVGFAGGLARYLPLYRGKNEEYKSTYLVKKITSFLIFSGVAGCVLVILASGFISNKIFHLPELKSFLIIFSFAIPISILSGIYFSILKSYEKIGWFAFIVNILQNSVKLLAIIALIFLGFSSKSIAVSYVVGAVIALGTSYIVSRKKIPLLFENKKNIEDKEIMKQLLSYSWPLIFFGFISSILSWTDTFMIGVLRTTAEVGFYNAAVPIALIITISTDLFRQMLLPLITKEYGRGNIKAVKEISRQVTKWLFIVSIPLFAALFIFPQQAIQFLFGAEYLSAANALKILAIGFFISSVLDVSPEVLSMKGRSKLILIDTLIVGVLNVILNYFFIPLYGISGAALSTTLSISCLSILFTYQVWKDSSILIIKRNVLRVLLSGFISFVATWLISPRLGINVLGLIASGVLFILLYLTLLYITRSIDKNDSMIIRAIRGKITRMSNIKVT